MSRHNSMLINPRLIVLMAGMIATLACFILENARVLPDRDYSEWNMIFRSLSAFSASFLGLWLSVSVAWQRGLRYLIMALCQYPLVIYFYNCLSYGYQLPFEKLVVLVIECQIIMLSLFLSHDSIRRTNMVMAGIVSLIGYSSIQDLKLNVDLAMAILILLIPVWLVLEHALAHPVFRHLQRDNMQYISRNRRRAVKSSFRIVGYLLVAFSIMVFSKNDKSFSTVLGQWVGSSGGTGEMNQLATSGVGDGPNEVSASENPESTGFTDSEIYLETDQSSLFDAFNEQYGEPFKKQKFERMQAMGLQDIRENGDRPKENLQAGRTFELSRRNHHQKPGELKDRAADALIYVQGEPEKRLKLASFDRFDGQSWFTEHDCGDDCSLIADERQKGKCWFCIHQPVSDVISGTMEHKIKIANLETSVLPSPNNLSKFVVGGIKQAEMFGWAGLHMIRILDRTFPAGTTLETVSNRISRRALFNLHFHQDHQATRHHRHFASKITQVDSNAIRNLINQWEIGDEMSWMQVELLVRRLRDHARLSFDQTISNTINEPIFSRTLEDFLFGSKTGPDYMFASAAVVLLRELGYPCRLASGFYVHPESYDEQKSHYAITSENMHFWVEVLLPTNNWAVVDPTPGYTDELKLDSFADLVWIWSYYARAWLLQHLVAVVATICGLAFVFFFRRQIYDLVFCFYLSQLMPFQPRRKVVLTMRHLEWRMASQGIYRPKGCTIRKFWLESLALGGHLTSMVTLGEWAAYSGVDTHAHCSGNEIQELCSMCLRKMNMKYFSQIQSGSKC